MSRLSNLSLQHSEPAPLDGTGWTGFLGEIFLGWEKHLGGALKIRGEKQILPRAAQKKNSCFYQSRQNSPFLLCSCPDAGA